MLRYLGLYTQCIHLWQIEYRHFYPQIHEEVRFHGWVILYEFFLE
jgi:hypothetical protein